MSVKIDLISSGILDFLKSSEVQQEVKRIADDIKNTLGDGYETDSHVTPSRVVSSVYTTSNEAYRDNLNNNTLLKAVSK